MIATLLIFDPVSGKVRVISDHNDPFVGGHIPRPSCPPQRGAHQVTTCTLTFAPRDNLGLILSLIVFDLCVNFEQNH